MMLADQPRYIRCIKCGEALDYFEKSDYCRYCRMLGRDRE
jgi:hypothetical protein